MLLLSICCRVCAAGKFSVDGNFATSGFQKTAPPFTSLLRSFKVAILPLSLTFGASAHCLRLTHQQLSGSFVFVGEVAG